jgi:hypothetical protein
MPRLRDARGRFVRSPGSKKKKVRKYTPMIQNPITGRMIRANSKNGKALTAAFGSMFNKVSKPYRRNVLSTYKRKIGPSIGRAYVMNPTTGRRVLRNTTKGRLIRSRLIKPKSYLASQIKMGRYANMIKKRKTGSRKTKVSRSYTRPASRQYLLGWY